MNNCVVCLSTNAKKGSRIYIQSNEWNKLNIQRIIEKHFWWLHVEQSSTTILKWICRRCWQELSSFHAFYKIVETLHKEYNLHKWPVLSSKNSKKREGIVKPDVNLQQSLVNENTKMGVNMDIYLGDKLLKPIKMANYYDEPNNDLIVANKFNRNENNIQNIVELHIENEIVSEKEGDVQKQAPDINKIKDCFDIGSGNSFIKPIKFAFHYNDNPNDNTDKGVMMKEKFSANNVQEFNIKKETITSGEDVEVILEINDSMDSTSADDFLEPIKRVDHCDVLAMDKTNKHLTVKPKLTKNFNFTKSSDINLNINKIKGYMGIDSGNNFIKPIKIGFHYKDNPNDNTDKETVTSDEDGEPLICDDDKDIMEVSDSKNIVFYGIVKKENEGGDVLLAPKDDVQQISDDDEVILEINDSMDSTSVDDLLEPIKKVDHFDVLAMDNKNKHLKVEPKLTKSDNFTKLSNINKIKDYMDIDSGNSFIKPIKIAFHYNDNPNDYTDKGVIVKKKFSAKNVDEFDIERENITSGEDGEPLICDDDKDSMEASDSSNIVFYVIVKKDNDGGDALLAPKDDVQQISDDDDDDEVILEIYDSMDITSVDDLLEPIKKVDHCDVLAIDNTKEHLTVVPKFTKNYNITKSSNINLNMRILNEFQKVDKKENYKDHVQATSEYDDCTNKVRDYISTVWEDQHLDTNKTITNNIDEMQHTTKDHLAINETIECVKSRLNNHISDSLEHYNENFLGYTTLIEKPEYKSEFISKYLLERHTKFLCPHCKVSHCRHIYKET